RSITHYANSSVIALQPPLLSIAAVLLLIDALISLWLRGHLALPRRSLAALPVLFLVLAFSWPHQARAGDVSDMDAADATRLAYVKTGLPDVDAMSRAGLY